MEKEIDLRRLVIKAFHITEVEEGGENKVTASGKMTIEKLSEILRLITENTDVVGFTVAEYLPFDEHRLHKMFAEINLFID